MKTLKELSDELAKKQPQMADSVTEEAPILNIIPFQESSHPMWNMAEEVADVTGAGWVDMNAPLPVVDASTNLRKVDLNVFGGEIEVPEDTAKMFGGKERYFGKKMPKVLRRSGMTAEQRILYENMRQYAIDNGKAITAGASSGGTYSIICCRFSEGENCGLYSPEGFKQGAMLDIQPINGGDIYKPASGLYAGVLVYGLRLKAYLGYQLLNANTVSTICNIAAGNIPTAMMIDDMIAKARGVANGKTFLFMHPRCKSLLASMKGTALNMTPEDKNYDRQLEKWSGIPLMTSFNMLDAGETVTSGLPASF